MQTESQLMLFAEDSPVNRSVLQVSKEVQMMIDTYGQKCSGLSRKSVLDGLLVKMLADSSAWHSMMCRLTWKTKATKLGRLLFQLVPKTLTTDEIEFGLWGTPNTLDGIGRRSYEAMKRQATNGGRKNRRRLGNLREQVDPLMCQAYKEASAEANGVMWPTPRSCEAEGGVVKNTELNNGSFSRKNKKGVRFGVKLKDAIALLPTPSANEDAAGTPNGNIQRMLGNSPEVRGNTKEEWSKGALNPDWVEPLMGYPVGWTDLAKDNVTGSITEFVGNPDDSGEPRVTKRGDGRAQRLKQLGNSIVPQVASEIFKAIAEVENAKTSI